MPFCGKCGMEVEPTERFCANCGSPQGEKRLNNHKQQKAPSSRKPAISYLSLFFIVTALAVIAVLGGYIIMGINEQAKSPDPTKIDTSGPDQSGKSVFDESDAEKIDTDGPDQSGNSVFDELDADYYIDYENGTIPLGELPIGARVVDPSWSWEFRTGYGYNLESGDETKPVTWLVVAKDHYDGLEPHVTLLSEELIGRHAFDNSTNRDYKGAEYGYNHWGDSGTANADCGLRPWLDSTDIHAGEGFYQAFSDNFKGVVLLTTLPNKEWKNGRTYTTSDYVFIPSTTELGDTEHNWTYPIGTVYTYFQRANDAKRVAALGGDIGRYWTRSPRDYLGDTVSLITSAGEFIYTYGFGAFYSGYGVRPALNLKSDILVSEPEHKQKSEAEPEQKQKPEAELEPEPEPDSLTCLIDGCDRSPFSNSGYCIRHRPERCLVDGCDRSPFTDLEYCWRHRPDPVPKPEPEPKPKPGPEPETPDWWPLF